jgi:hypothetical protein
LDHHLRFASASKAKVSRLQTALNNTKKKDMAAEKYLSKMTGFRSELGAAGKTIEDEEMISYITACLMVPTMLLLTELITHLESLMMM